MIPITGIYTNVSVRVQGLRVRFSVVRSSGPSCPLCADRSEGLNPLWGYFFRRGREPEWGLGDLGGSRPADVNHGKGWQMRAMGGQPFLKKMGPYKRLELIRPALYMFFGPRIF